MQASELNDLADSINGAMPSDASAKLKRLYKYIQDAADDAHAFAAQAASDAKRHQLSPPGPTPAVDATCQSNVGRHSDGVPEEDKVISPLQLFVAGAVSLSILSALLVYPQSQ